MEDGSEIEIYKWNEIKKLEAAWFDRMSTVCFTVGVAAPIAANTFSPDTGRPVPLLGFVFWIFSGVVLHILARFSLLEMRKP